MSLSQYGMTLGAAAFAFLTTLGAQDLLDGGDEPQPVALVLGTLKWEDGKVVQQLHVQGTDVLKAEWAAKFERDGVALCGGGGEWPYTGGLGRLAPSDWTGDDCPEILPGDKGIAVWTWTDTDGTVKSIRGELTRPQPSEED